VIFIACVILQILGNIAWSYRDDIKSFFLGKPTSLSIDVIENNADFGSYSNNVKKLANYIHKLKEIRKSSDDLSDDYYFKDKFVKQVDDEIVYAENRLNQAVGKEVLMKNKEATP